MVIDVNAAKLMGGTDAAELMDVNNKVKVREKKQQIASLLLLKGAAARWAMFYKSRLHCSYDIVRPESAGQHRSMGGKSHCFRVFRAGVSGHSSYAKHQAPTYCLRLCNCCCSPPCSSHVALSPAPAVSFY